MILLYSNDTKPSHIHFQDKFAVRAGLKDRIYCIIREIVGSYIEQRVSMVLLEIEKANFRCLASELGIVTPEPVTNSFPKI
jgi:hypothetical protein